MNQLLRTIFVCLLFISVSAFGSQTIFKVLEQSENGDSTHRALDRSSIGDGIDPVLQFILLEEPTDPATAQLIWEASETPIPWARSDQEHPYRMVEYAVLPTESVLEYRIFVEASGDELVDLRHSRTEEDDTYSLDEEIVNDLPDGRYNIHVHLLVPDRPTTVLMQRIEVSEFVAADPLEPGQEEQAEPATLEPGSGFKGETEQPEAVGNLTTNTMARWDVVPLQAFEGEFEVGVVAHHSYGIDRVEISFNGGPWVAINEPTLNLRTNVKEYWGTIDANDVPDGKVELRAIAYPKNGTPRLLEPLTLWANAGGSVDMPVYYIKQGEVEVPRNLDAPEDRWVTVKYAAGANQPVWFNTPSKGNIKLEGLNIAGGPGAQGGGRGGKVWFDDVTYSGIQPGRGAMTDWTTNHWYSNKYYTETTIEHVRNPLHVGEGIVRNVELKNVYEDAIRMTGLITNVKVDRMQQLDPNFHPDVFQWHGQLVKNMIVQGLTVTDAVGQGLSYGGNTGLEDCAFVDIDLELIANMRPIQMAGITHNVLLQNFKATSPLEGLLRYSKGFRPKDLVFRDVNVGNEFPFLPIGWENREIKVYPLMDE